VHILYHHRTLADGAEGIHIHQMIEAFRALGHRVTVQALARPRASGEGHVGALSSMRRRIPNALYECAAAALNVTDYAAVRRSVRRDRVDLVYKRHALLDVGATIAARHTGTPVVVEANTAYSAPAVRQFEPIRLLTLARRAERLAMQSAALVVAVSTPLADYLRELTGGGVRVLMLPNGVDPVMFDPSRIDGHEIRARYGLQGQFVVGWAGVLRRWHGLEVMLDALASIPSAHLLLIGDGPDRPVFERLAQERGLLNRLTVTGRLRHADVPAHLAAIDVAVAADDRTGFASPMKVVEYMAMARAVVLPHLRNFEDLVQHERTGLFFSPGDAMDLARIIVRLEQSTMLRERLGAAARTTVEERLNWRDNAIAVLDAVAGATGSLPSVPKR
jgi:glycosyltransferase involved in cell wall biosynthesis